MVHFQFSHGMCIGLFCHMLKISHLSQGRFTIITVKVLLSVEHSNPLLDLGNTVSMVPAKRYMAISRRSGWGRSVMHLYNKFGEEGC